MLLLPKHSQLSCNTSLQESFTLIRKLKGHVVQDYIQPNELSLVQINLLMTHNISGQKNYPHNEVKLQTLFAINPLLNGSEFPGKAINIY